MSSLVSKLLSLLVVFAILPSCESYLEKCIITEFEKVDPTFSDIVNHLNQDLAKAGSNIRVIAKPSLNDKKLIGKIKIGQGNFVMFCQGARDIFNCKWEKRNDRVIFRMAP